jgi:excisionase family DNA binding protein
MSSSIPEPIFLSAPKAATLCGVSRNTICCWIRDGKLPSYSTAGGKYLIRPVELIEFMQGNKMFVPPALEEMAEDDERRQKGHPTARREITQEPAILVVDDDPGAHEAAERILTPLGLPILHAEDGYEALHLLTKNPLIALVVLDLNMPGQPGEKTLSELREPFPALPVIVCTGQSLEEAEDRLKDKRPDLILTKPYQPSHLLRAASTFLDDLGF